MEDNSSPRTKVAATWKNHPRCGGYASTCQGTGRRIGAEVEYATQGKDHPTRACRRPRGGSGSTCNPPQVDKSDIDFLPSWRCRSRASWHFHHLAHANGGPRRMVHATFHRLRVWVCRWRFRFLGIWLAKGPAVVGCEVVESPDMEIQKVTNALEESSTYGRLP